MNSFKKILCFGLIVAVASLTSNVALSKTLTPMSSNCQFGASLAGGADLTTSTACQGFGGNDTNTLDVGDDIFGITDWTLSDKTDGGAGSPIAFSAGDYTGKSGTWSVASFAGYTDVLITLKAGKNFVAFLLDTAFLGGDWTTDIDILSNKKGKAQGISHLSIYYSPSSLSVVPLPAALPLYGAGIVVLGFLGWRKRAGQKQA
ncbi:MAG: hypothetical protein V7750_00450 [Sneathiella sp.]